MRRLSIAMVCREFHGFGPRKSGVSDATFGLSRALVRQGHRVTVIMPHLKGFPIVGQQIDPVRVGFGGKDIRADICKITPEGDALPDIMFLSPPSVGFVDPQRAVNKVHVEKRLGLFFDRAAVDLLKRMRGDFDIAHAHTGNDFFAYFAKENGLDIPVLYTLHHLERGDELSFKPEEFSRLTGYGRGGQESVNPYVAALERADRIITVSQNYAQELQSGRTRFTYYKPVLDRISHKLFGILNGLDREYTPEHLFRRQLIPRSFTSEDLSGRRECNEELQRVLNLPVDPEIPVVLWSHRLVENKGVAEFSAVTNRAVGLGMQVIIFGQGIREYEEMFERKESRWPQQIRFVPFIQDNAEYEPLFIAGSQLVVLPSLEEPCGQLAMKAMRLGTPPLVNPVGGLAEIVNDGYNGFVVPSGGDSMESRVSEMMVRLNSRIREKDENWRRMQQRAMEAVSDWDRPAEHYTAHYRSLIKQKSLNHKNKTCCPF